MKTFQEWAEQSDWLEIVISIQSENGVPVSSVMKHRRSKNGKWEYDSDMDSGEQGGLKELPRLVGELLPKCE